MGGKNSGNDEAEQARKDENARQAQIRAGTANINAIFDGGTSRQLITPTGKALDFDSGEYYDANGNRLHGKINTFDNEQVYGAPTTQAGQFNDAFFDKIKQGYIDYATPQLQQQYQDAGKDLTFSLARSGLLNSSARAQQEGRLQQLYDTNAQDIADKALSYESDARNNVEDARSNLITTLNATGDAQGAANSAIARASALSTAPSYSALGQLFTDFTGTLNTAAAQQKAAAASVGAYSPSTAGLYGNAGKVTVSR